MEITYEQFVKYVLTDLLKMRSKLVVLEASFYTLAKNCNAGLCDELYKASQNAELKTFESLLLKHPFLKNDYGDLLHEAFPDLYP